MKIKIKSGVHVKSISPGIAYAVIGVDDIYYRVINDSEEPVLYKKDVFDVIDPHVPEHWIRRDYSDGEFYLNPPEFSEVGFFEDYFDGDQDALNKYNRYLIMNNPEKAARHNS